MLNDKELNLENCYKYFLPLNDIEKHCENIIQFKDNKELCQNYINTLNHSQKKLCLPFLTQDYIDSMCAETIDDSIVDVVKLNRFYPTIYHKNDYFELIYNPIGEYFYKMGEGQIYYDFPNGFTAEKIRINSSKLGLGRQGYAMQMMQFDVYETNCENRKINISRFKPVTISDGGVTKKDSLTDGNFASLCSSSFYKSEHKNVFFEIDLKGKFSLTDICLFFRTDSYIPQNFTIDTYDGFKWDSIITVDNFYLKPNITLKIEEGSICITTPMLRHAITSREKDNVVFSIKFSRKVINMITEHYNTPCNFLSFLLQSKKQTDPYIVKPRKTKEAIDMLFKLLVIEANTNTENNNLVKMGLLYNILSYLLIEADSKNVKTKSTKNLQLVNEIISYIEINYKTTTVNKISKHFNYSSEYLTRLIKRYTGSAINEIILKRKIIYAKTLLVSTSYSISEISSLSGFNSLEHFSRMFKKETGVSPTSFRVL